MATGDYESTGSMNQSLGNKSLREVYKDAKLMLYEGEIPTSADAAVTGTLVATITTAGASAKVKQLVTVTPVVGDASSDVWSVTLNGQTAYFTDDGTPSVAEVCTGLVRALDILQGKAAQYITTVTDGAITAGARLNIPDVYQLFTITDNTTNFTIEAATAGVSFEYSATVTGATTATLTAALTTDSAYGLRFETYANVASGILEKLSTDTWKGTAVAAGSPITYGRLVLDDDTGALSTTQPRFQSLVSTANAGIVVTHVDVASGEEVTVTSFSVNMSSS